MYRELHPEDTDVTVDDIHIETLETVLVNDVYNDLGFIVRSGDKARFVILVEAQSKWTENLTLRMLIYIVETYRRYLKETQQSEHLEKRIILPKPEFYVVYTGSKEVADEVSFSETYFGGDSPLDLRLRVLRQPCKDTLHGQYIGFCKVYDEQRKIHSNKIECIKETIRICFEKGYLIHFLDKHRQEATSMMSELFDEQAIREQYEIALMKQHEEKGRAEGKTEGRLSTLIEMVKKGIITIMQAAELENMTVAEFEARAGLTC